MLDVTLKKIGQPSIIFVYPSQFSEPSEADNAITEFVRANHEDLEFIDPPTRRDTFDLVKGDREIIAIAAQLTGYFFIAVHNPEKAKAWEEEKFQKFVFRLDYLKISRELLPKLGEALAGIKKPCEIERLGW